MNVKAIAGYLGTQESEVAKVQEFEKVYFVHVRGFRPRFVSKKAVAAFIEVDARAYNSGRFAPTASAFPGCDKNHNACPMHASPQAKAHKEKLGKMWASAKITGPASAFFPAQVRG